MNANFYLKKLIIQNFATFKNQTISFRPGFNAIIGETGSGKSLVLDALQLILGGRADKRVVRKDTDYSLIEASFFCEDAQIQAFLESEGFPLEGKELIIKRMIYKNGTAKTYVNHLSTTVTFLSTFARRYIDLVGQFENQKLLSESYQLQLLDHFAKISGEVNIFGEKFHLLRAMERELKTLRESQAVRGQRLDYLNYQLEEISKLNPSSQDEEDLLRKKNLLVNLEKYQKISLQLKDIFEGGEGNPGLLSQIKLMSSIFTRNVDSFRDELGDLAEIEDRLLLLQEKVDQKLSFEVNPEEMEGVLDRLDLYQKLKKKFGGSVETVLQTQVEFLKEKDHLSGLDINVETLEKDIAVLTSQLQKHGKVLHEARTRQAGKLSALLTEKIRGLKMNGATLRMLLEWNEEPSETGFSRAYFEAETNPGEGYFKVRDVASGGELSRILLSVRQILSAYDSISIFLFDEIDTGIGGETALCIGKALQQVSANGQVIAITHLPQIAQYADSLIIVQKDVQQADKETRTESFVREIIGKMIQKEVRAMAPLA